jgi:glyoxylase-like metal-dependent hydrolase (beta-lactamase superfamily II)
LIEQLGLKLKYILDTHVHADHVTGSGLLRDRTNAQVVVGKAAQVECANIGISDGETVAFGEFEIKALSTPGHTNGCTSYYVEGMVFTGDALLIRGNGRTDFQQGSSEKLYESVTKKLYTLSDDTLVYPAHDYKGMMVSSIDEEKKYNLRINARVTKDEFVKTMGELKLANPKKIHEAVPANMVCGRR